jgi:hypothetical protein
MTGLFLVASVRFVLAGWDGWRKNRTLKVASGLFLVTLISSLGAAPSATASTAFGFSEMARQMEGSFPSSLPRRPVPEALVYRNSIDQLLLATGEGALAGPRLRQSPMRPTEFVVNACVSTDAVLRELFPAGQKAGCDPSHSCTTAPQLMATNSLDDIAGAVCRVNSFRYDTQVLLADGTLKPILEVQVGDRVLSTDPRSGRTEARAVTAVHLTLDTALLTLRWLTLMVMFR